MFILSIRHQISGRPSDDMMNCVGARVGCCVQNERRILFFGHVALRGEIQVPYAGGNRYTRLENSSHQP